MAARGLGVGTAVTGVTAYDSNGVVTIYATSSGGSSGEGGALYKITDTSGVDGTLSGTATLIATAPANEAFRGVAFTPGTVFGSGGTPPPPAPEISLAESNLPAAMEDPTNPALGMTVSDPEYAAGELTVTVGSSNTNVAPSSGLSVSGDGAQRTLTVTPGSVVGHSTITLTVEAPNGASTSTTMPSRPIKATQPIAITPAQEMARRRSMLAAATWSSATTRATCCGSTTSASRACR